MTSGLEMERVYSQMKR